jgi:polysaccharide chain length determinant protein (PEP-CTERM system associated)
MPTNKTGALSAEISPLSIIRMLWKRKLAISSIWLVALAATAVTVYELPAIYKAGALVLVDSQKIPESYVTSTVSTDVADRLATISQEIMTTTRLLKIISTYNLYPEMHGLPQEEIVAQMRKDISLDVEKGWTGGRPGGFRVGYEGRNPSLVAEVANQLANLYVEENLKTRQVQAEGTTEFIESQLTSAKQELDGEEAKVAAFKVAHNGELPEQENSMLGALSNLQVQLQGNQDALNRAQQNKLTLETALATANLTERMLASAPARQGSSGGVGGAPGRLRSEALQEALDQMKLRYTADYPDVKRLEAEIERTKKQEAADAAEAAKAAKAAQAAQSSGDAAATAAAAAARPMSKEVLDAREHIAQLQTQLTLNNKDIEYLNAEHQRIIKAISAYQARVERLPTVEQEFAALTRDYDISKTNYKSLLDKKISAGMATDMELRQKSERFEIIDPARVPEVPFKPNRWAMSGIGVASSLSLGLLIGFLLEFRKRALLGEWELPSHIEVLGRVPFIVTGAVPARFKPLKVAAIASTVVIALLAIGAGVYWFVGRT